jgi:ATP-binding cassette subfamily F protein 3
MDIDSPLGVVRINIPPVEDMKKGLLLRLNSVAIGYGDKVIADKINLQINKGEHVAILGDNGQGKTTFLKTLVRELSPLTGTIKWAPDTEFSYYAQHIPEQMDKKEKVGDYLRRMAPPAVFEEQILKMAANFLFSQDDLEKSISVLSGGEKARLCLAGLLLTKKNTLLLDEPTNHLDFETVEALGVALEEYEGNIFFISHNRTFVNSIATSILEVNNGEVRRYASSYEDYIYYLEKRIQKEQLDEAKEKESMADEAFAELKKIQYQETKEEKNRLKKLEKAIKQLEEKRDVLSAKQTSDPVNFPAEDYELFGQIAAQLLDKEREWFELCERIDKMNRGEVI